MKLTAREWLNFAQKDLVNCERILDDAFLTNIVAFHSQQVVEKSFKAIVEEYGLGFIRTHDLLRLAETVRAHLPFTLDDNMIAILNEVYINSRYPGEFGLLPHGNPSTEEAESFYQFARNTFAQIQNLLAQPAASPESEEQEVSLRGHQEPIP